MGTGLSRAKGLEATTIKRRKAKPMEPCTASTRAFKRGRQVVTEDRHGAAKACEDEDPEQHGAFVVSPDAGNFIEQRLGRMGILKHVPHGEIGNQIGMGECGKGHIDEHELNERGGNRRQRSSGCCPRSAPISGTRVWKAATASARMRAKCPISAIMALPPCLPARRLFPSACRPRPWACSSHHAWPEPYRP